MSEYPIPVAKLDGKKATTLVCEGCGFTRQAKESEFYSEPECFVKCEKCGEGMPWKYAQADQCPACKRLGWWHTAYDDNACSRVCHLQLEYAKELAA